MAKCKYEYKPGYGEELPRGIPLDCCEESIKNGEFWFFHDKNHYAQHEVKATERFKEKVNESIKQNKPLVCIGYYLRAINFANLLEGKSFAQPAYFTDAHSQEQQALRMLNSQREHI